MLVKEVMSAPAVTVDGDLSVKQALQLLDRHRVTALPVVDRTGSLLGVVSEADLLRGAVHHDPRRRLAPAAEPDPDVRTVREVMTPHALTLGPDSDVADAVEVMVSTAVKSMPVLDGDRVVGVLSRSDVVHLLAREDQSMRAEIDELLRSADLDFDVEVDDGLVVLDGPDDPHERRIAEVLARSAVGVLAVRFR